MKAGKVTLAKLKKDQDDAVSAAAKLALEKKSDHLTKLAEEAKLQGELWVQEQALANIKEVHRVTENRLAAAEKQRRNAALSALHIRILRRWRARANDDDPKKAQPMERWIHTKPSF